ncbi:hypothetical protein ACRAWF_44605 [Streptomyces sp. L7]
MASTHTTATKSSRASAVSFIRRTPRCFSSSAALNVVIVRRDEAPSPSAPTSVRSIRSTRSPVPCILSLPDRLPGRNRSSRRHPKGQNGRALPLTRGDPHRVTERPAGDEGVSPPASCPAVRDHHPDRGPFRRHLRRCLRRRRQRRRLPAGGRGAHNSAAPASAGTWVGAWSAAPVGGEPGTGPAGMAGRSVRNVVHTSAAGTSARITLSNLYGRSPLTFTHASIALAAGQDSSAAAPGTMRRLTFGGATSVTVPAGRRVLSDAVRLQLPQGADVLVTTYAPAGSGPVTYHPYARQTSYIADGDRAEDPTAAPYTRRTAVWRYFDRAGRAEPRRDRHGRRVRRLDNRRLHLDREHRPPLAGRPFAARCARP